VFVVVRVIESKHGQLCLRAPIKLDYLHTLNICHGVIDFVSIGKGLLSPIEYIDVLPLPIESIKGRQTGRFGGARPSEQRTLNRDAHGSMLRQINLCNPRHDIFFGILPHGIFEIPALILSSAAVLYIGIALVTPRSQRTLGEVLIETIADWTKIGIGLVLPLLTIAAVVETWVTPVLLMSMLK